MFETKPVVVPGEEGEGSQGHPVKGRRGSKDTPAQEPGVCVCVCVCVLTSVKGRGCVNPTLNGNSELYTLNAVTWDCQN